jgi:hypothetical protein
VTHCRIQLEMEIDFASKNPRARPPRLVAEMDAWPPTGRAGATGEGVILRDGLAWRGGPANVGKSSIFNAFLQPTRHCYSGAGTTRDLAGRGRGAGGLPCAAVRHRRPTPRQDAPSSGHRAQRRDCAPGAPRAVVSDGERPRLPRAWTRRA